MTLADFTQDSLCLPQLGGEDIAEVLSTLSRALERERVATTALSLFSVAFNRYFLSNGSTVGAVAYSVGRLPSVRRSQFAVGRIRGISGVRPNGAPVYLVFLLATPAEDPRAETTVIGGLKRLVNDAETLGMIHSADAGWRMRDALARIELDTADDVGPRGIVIPDGAFLVWADQRGAIAANLPLSHR